MTQYFPFDLHLLVVVLGFTIVEVGQNVLEELLSLEGFII
jgi:hypothetical protein